MSLVLFIAELHCAKISVDMWNALSRYKRIAGEASDVCLIEATFLIDIGVSRKNHLEGRAEVPQEAKRANGLSCRLVDELPVVI